MQYGQIVFILFILLIIYYIGMIVMDLQKARAAQAAELDDRQEEDIDISDEAQNFKPVQVSRDEPRKKEDVPVSNEEDTETNSHDDSDSNEENDIDGAESSGEEDGEGQDEQAMPGEEAPSETETSEQLDEGPHMDRKPLRRPGYREAVMTGGVSVETLIEDVDKLVLTGQSDLGAIVFSIANME